MVEVKDGRRVRRGEGPGMLASPAIHFFAGAMPGGGALVGGLAGRIHGPLAMGILLSLLLGGLWRRVGGSADIGRVRTRGSVAMVSVVQQVVQACNPGPRSGIAFALLWREGEKHPGRAQRFFQPPASPLRLL